MPGNPITEGLHVEEGTDEQQLRKLLKELIDSVNKSTDQQKKFFKSQQAINDLLLKDAKKSSRSKTEDEAFKHFTESQRETIEKEEEQIDLLRAMLNVNVKLKENIERDYKAYGEFIKNFSQSKEYTKNQRAVSKEHGYQNARNDDSYFLKSFRDRLIEHIPLLGLMTGIFPNSPGSDKWKHKENQQMMDERAEGRLYDMKVGQMAESVRPGAYKEHIKSVDELGERRTKNYNDMYEFMGDNKKKKEQRTSQRRNAKGQWMKESPLLLEAPSTASAGKGEGFAYKADIVSKPGPMDPSKADVQKLPAAYSTGALYIGGLLEDFLGTKEKQKKEGGGGAGGLLGGLKALGGRALLGGLEAGGGSLIALLGAILGTAGLGIGLGFGAVKLKELIQGKQKEKADKEAQDIKELQEMWQDQAFLKSKGVDPSTAMMGLSEDQEMKLLRDFQKKKYGDLFKKNKESGGWWNQDQKKPGAKDDGGTLPGTRGAQTVFRGMPGEKVVPERDFTKMVELLAQSVETNKQVLEELKKNTEATSSIKLETKKVPPAPNKEFLKTSN